MKIEQIIEILKNALGTDSINSDTTKENCAEWDSFNHLVVVADLERELELEFTIEETEQMDSVADILAIIEKKN